MNTNDFEIVESITVIEISPQTHEIVEKEMAGESDEVKRETKALIEALRNRAKTEAESAGTFTRETYLNAVRKARAAIEGGRIFQRDAYDRRSDRLEYFWMVFQEELEKNWHLMMKEFVDFSSRLQNAIKVGWEAFNTPRHQG
ncbi:hypothetical protein [Anabaena sp. CA = ATCC 33047]|uniref:hypothetical protein n=1 Tax=Anabaena sp. (strain CA / ATCC 33047) TaxID=52271 RepID=UPI000834BC22|nr:hypothetical protein [Anabaena sp. CA = ATCC 33047]